MQSQTKMLQFTKKYIKIGNRPFGEMSEWSNVPAWKASIPQGIGGSNPLLSATKKPSLWGGFFVAERSKRALQSKVTQSTAVAVAICYSVAINRLLLLVAI